MPNYSYTTPGPSVSFGQPWTPAVKTLILANLGVFFLQFILIRTPFGELFGLQVPELFSRLRLWQLGTYLFLHAGFWHLALNMFALWMFGCEVEQRLGTRRFYYYYFITGIGAGIFVALVSWLTHERSITIGASGAIFGILMAYGILFAERQITLLVFFILPVTLKAKYMVLLFGAFELLAGVGKPFGQVSHLAHLSGLLVGFLYFFMLFPQFRQRMAFWKNLHWRFTSRHVRRINPDDEVDEILAKISRQGINALSRRERDILAEAARRRGGWPRGN